MNQTNQLATIEQAIKKLAPSFTRLCTNKDEIVFGRESKFALTAVRTTFLLQKCELESIKEAVMQVAYVGLTLNPIHGYCYLVPFNEKDAPTRAKLMIGYKGMVKLATADRAVSSVESEIVFEHDEFYIEKGSTPRVVHRIKNIKGRGKPVGAYCIATLPNGKQLIEFMDEAEINKCREVAKTKNVWDGPWKLEQWRKTVIRRAWKRWPRSEGLEHAEEVMAKLEPAEFDQAPPDRKQEAQAETNVVVISDEQHNTLHAMLIDNGISEKAAPTWLNKLAESEGYQKIAELPADKFDSVKAKLAAGIAAAKERHKEAAQ